VTVELANLRVGHRWAMERDELSVAALIAASATMLSSNLLVYEPLGWAEETLERAGPDLPELALLCSAAGLCSASGRTEESIVRSRRARELAADPHYLPISDGMNWFREAAAQLFAGRIEEWIAICTDLVGAPGLSHVVGTSGLVYALPAVGRAEEAMAMAGKAVADARAYGNPVYISLALYAYGRAFVVADPAKALRTLRDALSYTQEHRVPNWEALVARDLAVLEAEHGEIERALELFDGTLDMLD
jgi:tetratricopeptide (TPR) repeat protein